MENNAIVEHYSLPSKGKIYSKEINPVISLRSMTTEDEMRRLSPSDRQYKVMADIIDNCILEKLPISSYDMCVGDYLYLLHKIRIVTYGPDYKIDSICPFCGAKNTVTINLDNLPLKEFNEEEVSKYMSFDLPKTGSRIKLRMQTPRMLDDIQVRSKEFKHKSSAKLEPAFLYGLQLAIDTVDGEKLNEIQMEDFLRKLPMIDTNHIIQYYDKLNSLIGIDTVIEITCQNCDLDYQATFRQTNEFFRPTINL